MSRVEAITSRVEAISAEPVLSAAPSASTLARRSTGDVRRGREREFEGWPNPGVREPVLQLAERKGITPRTDHGT